MAELYERDARQAILIALAQRDDRTLAAAHLEPAIRAAGCVEPPEWLIDQLDWMRRMGAVTIRYEGETALVTMTEKGARHVLRERLIEGIGRPSLARMGVDLIAKGLKGG